MDGANQLRKIYKSLTGEDSPRRFITPERLKADNAHNRAITMLDLVPRSKRLEKAPEAVKILKEVISQRERHPEAPINIDLLAWELGTDSRGAITNRLRDRAAADPSYSFALRSFAWTLAQEGEAKNTLGLLERIAKREPDWGWIQNLRGILLLALDSPGQALTALERAAQLEPARWEYLYNLGVCLSRQGKHDEALDKMEKAMALSSDPRITVGMAVVLGALSRTPEAEEVLLSGHGRNGDSAWLNYHLGALYGAMGIRVPGFDSQEVDLKKSMGYLKASFQKAPGFHRVRDAIGEIGRRLNIQNIQRDLPSLIHRQPAGQEEKDLGTLWKARCYKVMNAHREGVLCVDISWDGRTIVSGGMDDVTCIWDPLTGQLVGLLRGHEDWVRAVCISADGSLILSGSKDGTARLWQRSDGRNLQTFKGHEGEIYGVAMSTDFRYGATGGDDRKLRIWDLRSGDLVRTLQGHKNRITSVALNYNGSRVLTGSVDRTVRLWDVESGKCIETMLGHEAEVNSVAMSNDGAFALSGCQDGSIRLWNLATGESLREFRGHEKEVRSVDIAPDLRFGLSGSWDGTVRLWDLGLGECICVMGGHEGPVMGVAILTDGRFGLSAGRDHSVRMWEWKEEALPLAIPPAALCPSDLTRVEREVEEDERFQSLFAGAQESLTRGDLAESYRLARIAQAVPEREREPLLMDLLAKITEKLERRSLRAGWVARTLKGHEDWIGAIALSSDDKLLLSGSLDTTMRLWDMERSETVRTFRGHGREVSCVAFFLDGSRVLSGSTDKTLRVWNRATGESVAVMKGHNHDVTGCAVVPDGGTAVSSSLDGTLRLWSTKNADQIRQIPVSEGVVYCTALSPDGRLAFSAGQDRTLRLWSTASGKAVRELKGHNAILRAVAVSPSSPHALTGGEDGSVCLWKIDTGETVHRMEGHEGAVLCAVFMPGGTHGVTGGEDGTLRFWDLGQGKAAGVLKAHEGPVRGVAVTSKGRNVISCSHDNLIRVWELDWEWEI
jgi:WD40 repeat protein